MTADRDRDLTAWRKLQSSGPARLLDYRPDTVRQQKAKDRFRARVTRDPATRCWVWQGPVWEGRPITYQWDPSTGHNAKRSAFLWMMDAWFPGTTFSDRSRGTSSTCGTSRCISPFHRRGRTFDHITVLIPDQVRAIFAARDQVPAAALAADHGVSPGAIYGIWAGRHHANITGQSEIRKNPRKLTASQAREVYALRGKSTQQAVADKFNVSRSTVRHIWSGVTWSDVTGHQLSGAQPA